MCDAQPGRYYRPVRFSGRLIRGFFYAVQYIVRLHGSAVLLLGLSICHIPPKASNALGGIKPGLWSGAFLDVCRWNGTYDFKLGVYAKTIFPEGLSPCYCLVTKQNNSEKIPK